MAADRSTADLPLLRVVAGGPDHEQLAALIAVSLAKAAPAPPTAIPGDGSLRRAGWQHRYRCPGSWRA